VKVAEREQPHPSEPTHDATRRNRVTSTCVHHMLVLELAGEGEGAPVDIRLD
jgi:hypothetical protein